MLCFIIPSGNFVYGLNKTKSVNEKSDTINNGGYYLSSTGTIKILIIFTQFPDDNFDTANLSWPKNGSPYNINKWVDSIWTSNPTKGSLTHYFNEMSFNKLHVIGKSVWIKTPHERRWYIANNWQRYNIQKDVLQELNKKMDFAEFDNWTFKTTYNQINKPDGYVDLVFFVWRNISHDLPNSPFDSASFVFNKLKMGRDASLNGGGYDPDIILDKGLRKINPNTLGGGVTLTDYFSENMFRFVIHEFGHYLEGNNSMHVGFGFWGMCSAWGIKSFVINSFERYLLGWSKPKTIYANSPQILNTTLKDFITTGDSYKLVINDSTSESFLIENHQNLSYWENNQLYGKVEKGVYVIREDGPEGSRLQAIPAEGRYDWAVNQMAKNPWGSGELPVFQQLGQDRETGYHDLQFIPWNWKGIKQNPQPIHLMEDSVTGKSKIDVRFNGDGRDAFRMDYKDEFTPWSNPNNQRANGKTTNYGFKLKEVDSKGVYHLDIYTDLDEYCINHDAILSTGEWHISHNVILNKGITFTIQPGTKLIFSNNSSFIIYGKLIAAGTEKDHITFRNQDSTRTQIIFSGKDDSGTLINYLELNKEIIIQQINGSNVIPMNLIYKN